ncbi:hypothetical protein HDV02_002030 [Globomyces sp. JEL0801]|nr:hypothetical protein HDV02_002030 [Globomyces sp. JEL0801]
MGKRKNQDESDEENSETHYGSDDSDVLERIPLPKKPKPSKEGPAGTVYDFTMSFLSELKLNNNREWFNINRPRYEASKENFISLLTILLKSLSETDPDLANINVKDTLYRINKDIRFSKDKSPYKPYLSAHFQRDGKKSGFAGYYFQIMPNGQTTVGAGVFQPPTSILSKIRSGIDTNPSLLEESLKGDEVQKIFDLSGFDVLHSPIPWELPKLKRMPKGYPITHANIKELCLKSFVIGKRFTDDEVMQPEFSKQVIDVMLATVPFVHALNEYIEE